MHVKQDEAPRGVQRPEDMPQPWRPTVRQSRLALASLLMLCVFAAALWAYQSPYLTVNTVTVRGANEIPADQIIAASGLEGDSTIGLDTEGARLRIAAMPKVSAVTVERKGWTSVEIIVQERTAWGSWQINGVNVPIDADGYVLDGAPAPEGSPVIVEVEPQRVVNAGDRLDPGAVGLAVRLVKESETAFGRPLAALVYRQSSGLTAVLGSHDINGKGVWVTFGDQRDYDYKVATLYVLLEQAKQKDLALTAVDLRFGDRVSFN